MHQASPTPHICLLQPVSNGDGYGEAQCLWAMLFPGLDRIAGIVLLCSSGPRVWLASATD